MRRYSPNGCDVTNTPYFWTSNDCEIIRTQYDHPDRTIGMHTNGPAAIWIRRAPLLDQPAGPWINTMSHKMHVVREVWTHYGIRHFIEYENGGGTRTQ
jgi:hypothetical protein